MTIFRLISKTGTFVLFALVSVGTAYAGIDPGQTQSDHSIASRKSGAEATPRTHASKVNLEREIKSLSLTGLDGVRHSLADWHGKVIVINFWATWCSPCIYEIKDFVDYQEQYQARGLQIIGVGLDEEKKLRNVQRSLEINYPVLIADPVDNGGLMERWGNSSGVVPYTVVIDRDGLVKHVHHGLLSRDDFEEVVVPLLNKV